MLLELWYAYLFTPTIAIIMICKSGLLKSRSATGFPKSDV